jgi:mannan endo-1,6-alpha-mannosidase
MSWLKPDVNLYNPAIRKSESTDQCLHAPWEIAPYLKASVTPKIQKSATSAAKKCNGNSAKDTFCNFSWMSSRNSAFTGLGQQISALQIVLANLDRPQLATANQTGSGDGSESTGSSSTSASAPSSTAVHRDTNCQW